jgi:zinc transporter
VAGSPALPAAVLVEADGGHRVCTWDEVTGGLRAPEGGLLWVLVDPAMPVQSAWLQARAGVDPVARRALGSAEGRPGVSVYDDALVITLRGVNLNEGSDPEDMVTIRIWIESGRVILVRHHRVRAVEDVYGSFADDGAPKDASELLLRLVNALLARIADYADDVEELADAFEDQVLDPEDDPERGDLVELRRQVMATRRHLVPQRELFVRLHQDTLPVLSTAHLRGFRDAANRLARYVDDLESVRDRTVLVHEELAAREAERMNARMYLFTLIAGVFLPLGFLTGLLGINVGGMPGAENPTAFWWVCGICGSLGIGAFLGLRFSRWL